MKRSIVALVFSLLFCMGAVAGPKQFFRYVGHEVKLTITDTWHSKQWAATTFVTYSGSTVDVVTSCRWFGAGGEEGNFLLRGSQSCAAVAASSTGFTFVSLVIDHMFTDWFEQVCVNDNSQPEEWKHIKNPKQCRMAMWVLPIASVPPHAVAAYSNECQLNGGCVIHNDAFKKINLMNLRKP